MFRALLSRCLPKLPEAAPLPPGPAPMPQQTVVPPRGAEALTSPPALPMGLRKPLSASFIFPAVLSPERIDVTDHHVEAVGRDADDAQASSAGLAALLRRPLAVPAAPLSPAVTARQPPTHMEGRAPSLPVALALQGGGAHGAFTWGVLDRLLDAPDLSIDAISGASAGALNAVALAAGYAQDGRIGAQQMLARLWQRIADLAPVSPLRPMPLERLTPNWRSDWSPGHLLFDLLSRFVSPYQFNPFGIDPLRQILLDLIDFDALKQADAIPLFIAATRIDSGATRIFSNAELSIDTVLASACLPALNPAIRLDDGYYWDGGYSANPPLLPLVDQSSASDILLVRIDPMHDEILPMTAGGIRDRLNRIVFNAPLNAELRLLDWLRERTAAHRSQLSPLGHRLAQLRIHTLAADEFMRQLGNASKLTPDWTFISRLHDVGRAAANNWCETAEIDC